MTLLQNCKLYLCLAGCSHHSDQLLLPKSGGLCSLWKKLSSVLKHRMCMHSALDVASSNASIRSQALNDDSCER